MDVSHIFIQYKTCISTADLQSTDVCLFACLLVVVLSVRCWCHMLLLLFACLLAFVVVVNGVPVFFLFNFFLL